MIAKFKFSALTSRGKTISFVKQFTCQDFEILPGKVWNGHTFPPTSIDIQLMEWMDRQDKSQLMIEKDVDIIFDYELYQAKKRVPLVDFIKSLDLPAQVVIDMGAVYTKIKPSLKGKSNTEKVKLILSHLSVGYEAGTAAYQHISNTLRTPTPEKTSMTYEEYLQARKDKEHENPSTFFPIP